MKTIAEMHENQTLRMMRNSQIKMSIAKRLSVIVTTYNRPAALDHVLASIARQTTMPVEVIIADDGSNSETQLIVARWQRKMPVIHTWIPDSGFRAARSRNIAISRASSDYLVFIDGDCIIPPNFLRNHLKLSERGKMVAGGRYLLSQKQTNQLIENNESEHNRYFTKLKFRSAPLGPLRNWKSKDILKARTCNLGMFRADALAVEGFDEQYIGWGREDTDFVVRLLNNGIDVKSGRLACCVLHLWHEEASRQRVSANEAKLNEAIHSFSVTPKSSVLAAI